MSELPVPMERPDCLAALTDMQAAFVTNYVHNGGKARKAAEAAGYAPSSAHVTASRLLDNPLIIKAIYECSIMHLGRHVPAALNSVAKLSVKAKSEYIKLTASQDILDRVGMTAPKRVDVSGSFSVEIDLS